MQDFPYNFEEDVEHHNIWSTIPLDEKRMLAVGHPHPSFRILVNLLSVLAFWLNSPLPLHGCCAIAVHLHPGSSSLLLLQKVGRPAAGSMEAWESASVCKYLSLGSLDLRQFECYADCVRPQEGL